jgi:hypothetical protein
MRVDGHDVEPGASQRRDFGIEMPPLRHRRRAVRHATRRVGTRRPRAARLLRRGGSARRHRDASANLICQETGDKSNPRVRQSTDSTRKMSRRWSQTRTRRGQIIRKAYLGDNDGDTFDTERFIGVVRATQMHHLRLGTTPGPGRAQTLNRQVWPS